MIFEKTDRRTRLSVLQRIAAFWNHPNREHEMTLNRLVISALLLTYLAAGPVAPGSGVSGALIATIAFSAASIIVALHLCLRPEGSETRRLVAMATDLGSLSYCIHVGGETTSVLYPIYLWVIFGNGFRFGIRSLYRAMLVGVPGFAVVIWATPYWQANPHLAGGLLGGLVVLPLYTATLIRKLERAKQQAEAASRAKSLFLASVSHELRTPLNAVIGLSALLEEVLTDPEQHDMVRTIGTSGRALLALITDLLDFSRLEAGRTPAAVVDFDLHALLHQVKSMLGVQAREKGLQLSIHASARTPYRLRGDARHVQEILLNLACNALKFTAQGSVVIAVDGTMLESGRARLRFEVSDTGIGIALEARERIFESFTQADDSIIDRFGGTGLGLAIVKQLVELQGGRIGVESTVGEGSTFWFEVDTELQSDIGREPDFLADTKVVLLSRDPATVRAFAEAAAPMALPFEALACDDADWTTQAILSTSKSHLTIVIDEASLDETTLAVAEALQVAGVGATALVLLTTQPDAGLPGAELRRAYVASLSHPLVAAELAAAVHLTAGARRLPAQGSSAATPAPQRALKILVADDNRTNQKVISKILERVGHQVELVGDGQQALEVLRRTEVDLVLMDINMPVLNGVETTKLYRLSSIGRRRVPIIALTADATAEAAEECERAGMDGCLTKPIEPKRLLEVIGQMTAAATSPASDETVTPIPQQARPAARSSPALQESMLGDLQALGGDDFLAELIDGFFVDAGAVLAELRQAVALGDVDAFRDQLHAVRSGAANIGAQGVYELCLAWRQIEADELVRCGRNHVAAIEAEFTRAKDAAQAYLARARRSPAAIAG
jgi:two-component system sensor histidine kinase RpfC